MKKEQSDARLRCAENRRPGCGNSSKALADELDGKGLKQGGAWRETLSSEVGGVGGFVFVLKVEGLEACLWGDEKGSVAGSEKLEEGGKGKITEDGGRLEERIPEGLKGIGSRALGKLFTLGKKRRSGWIFRESVYRGKQQEWGVVSVEYIFRNMLVFGEEGLEVGICMSWAFAPHLSSV